MVESERRPFRGGTRSESARPLLTKEPRGGTHWVNPEALVWERDRFIHQDPIRGGQNLSDGCVKQGAKSAWDRITAPSLACCGRCPRLGEVRAEWILARSLSARRWEADR